MFSALTRLATTAPFAVLSLAVAFLVNAVVFGAGVQDRLGTGGTEDPASESAQAAALLDEQFPGSRPNLVLLVQAAGGEPVDDPETARQGARLAEQLAFEPGLSWVTSYWQTGADELKSRDGRYALIVARIGGDETAASRAFDELAPRYRGEIGDLVVRAGGSTAVLDEVQDTIADDLVRAELIALPITLLILVVVFGSVVAATLPLTVGVVAIIGTTGVIGVLSRVTDVSIFAQNLTTMLGFGLAVDYALLIVRRFREELTPGTEVRAAIARTLATAGRTVLFSALAVAVSLAAMLVFPTYFLRSFAYAGVSVVLLAAAAALLVVPAMLMLLGHRVDALDLRRLWRRRAAAGSPERDAGAARAHPARWAAMAGLVMRRAPLFTIAVTGLLLLLGSPFLRVEFGTTDDRQLPASAEARTVHDVLRTEFEARPTGVMELVATADPVADEDALDDYAARLSALSGVAMVQTPLGTYEQGAATGTDPADALRTAAGAVHLTLTPSVEDVSPESQQLVREVRALPAPFPVQVGGPVPALVDSQDAIADRLGWAVAMVAVVTVVLVFLISGGVLLALQALLVNALSLTAMFGAVVWVFQDGNGSGLLGFTPTGFIETSLPVLMFCVAFGLSMDYGLFLVSRMKEEYDRTGDHRGAVRFGLQRTGGLITAAALILAVVLVAAGTSRVANVMMLGLGVALAILVDALVVRCLLVPAVLSLTGRATWWAPPWLRRLHRRVGLREDAAVTGDPPAPPPAVPVPAGAGADAVPGGHSLPSPPPR